MESKNNIFLYFFLFVVLLALRAFVASQGYSGFGVKPKFGDYEAQRHWMEITTSLPLSEWYFNTTNNDLQYWGLDYPPLTAYHSFLLGKLSDIYEPGSVTLFSSRGYETSSHKFFMRFTVIISDLLLLLPSIYYLVNVFYRYESHKPRLIAFMSLGTQIGLLLIDHGHFQYNGVSLALSLFAIAFIMDNHDLIGSVFFVLSLNYKQMGLYYAPAFFLFLLIKNFDLFDFKSIFKVLQIGLTVIITFIILWMPFIIQKNGLEQVLQILNRVFPVGRGIYEDKVSNFWCSISPLFKLQNHTSQENMVRICLLFTLIGLIPSFFICARRIFKKRFLPKNENANFVFFVCNIAWSFFFFSFHVHEKSVLLPMVPMNILILYYPRLVTLLNLVSTASMIPLLVKDGHHYTTYILLVLLYITAIFVFDSVRKSRLAIGIIGIGIPLILDLFCTFVNPPQKYPDIFVLLLTSYCFVIMFLSWIVMLIAQLGLDDKIAAKMPKYVIKAVLLHEDRKFSNEEHYSRSKNE